ncbi:MAG: hypothetical protein QM749_03620 [Aquabacterium sp.]
MHAAEINMDQFNKVLATLNLTLCHTQELIGLAYQLSCELHPSNDAHAILLASGRLASLMHVSAQQLNAARTQAVALNKALARDRTGKTP